MKKEEKKQLTLEEAMTQNRPEHVPEEPTMDEIKIQALGEASAQARLGQQPPQGLSPQPKPMKTSIDMNRPPEIKPIDNTTRDKIERAIMDAEISTQNAGKDYSQRGMERPLKAFAKMVPIQPETGTIGPETVTMSESAQSVSPETGTIPVSNTDPPPADKTSTQESQEQSLRNEEWIINIDGTSKGNPGPAAYAYIVKNARTREVIDRCGVSIGTGTCNEAEYRGMIGALRFIKQNRPKSVVILSDSELIVKQLSGEYKVKAPSLQQLYQEASDLQKQLPNCEIRYIPREQNKEADILANNSIVHNQMHGIDRNPGEINEQEDTLLQDKDLRRLIEYVNSSVFNVNWVRMHLVHVVQNPTVVPSFTLWDGVSTDRVSRIVYDTIRMRGYVENTWPSLRMVMGTSRDNIEWAANVLCTIALFDVIRILSYKD